MTLRLTDHLGHLTSNVDVLLGPIILLESVRSTMKRPSSLDEAVAVRDPVVASKEFW